MIGGNASAGTCCGEIKRSSESVLGPSYAGLALGESSRQKRTVRLFLLGAGSSTGQSAGIAREPTEVPVSAAPKPERAVGLPASAPSPAGATPADDDRVIGGTSSAESFMGAEAPPPFGAAPRGGDRHPRAPSSGLPSPEQGAGSQSESVQSRPPSLDSQSTGRKSGAASAASLRPRADETARVLTGDLVIVPQGTPAPDRR